MKKIIRKIFLEELPRIKENRNKGCIDWKNSIGYIVKFIYAEIEGLLYIKQYNSDKRELVIIYNEKEFYITCDNLTKCAFGKILNKYTSEFKIEIGTRVKDNKRDFTITNREYRKDKNNKQWKYYKYTCNICGWTEGWIEEGNLQRGDNCSCCIGHVVIEGINDIPTTATWLIPYFQGGYEEAKRYTKLGTGNSNNKGGYIYPICPDCTRIKDKKIKIRDIYTNKSIGCICGDGQSFPNKIMFNILEQLGKDFIPEYNPEWIKPKRYDFYIPSLNLIIEMDGQFHKNDNQINGQTSEESNELDNYKDKLAKEHNIEVIRINCDYPNMETRFEYIKKNILNNKKLNNIFNLNIINWLKCNEFALSNRVKEACDLWNKEVYSIKEISSIMHINSTTTRTYLKNGTENNWCNYNGEKEQNKNIKKMASKTSKPIKCLTDNKSFKSIVEASKYYNMGASTISMVCLGKRKTAKGMGFEYEM
ncbi:UNVERIFIED_ORG: hypothetical protein B2H93_13540 [Clostridium botulinum]